MDYSSIDEALNYGGDYLFSPDHPYSRLTPYEKDEFCHMHDKRAIRANRKRALSLLREISPEIRQQMAARVATTLDAFDGQAIDYDESPRNLGWGFRHPS